MAVEREWELLEGETHLAIRSDRRDHLPYGLYSGKPGTGSLTVLTRDGGREVLPVMISSTLKKGDVLYHRQPGGGGWGEPLDRPAETVRRDVKNEKVSIQAARDEYGVVFDDDLAVDHEATEVRRRQLRHKPITSGHEI